MGKKIKNKLRSKPDLLSLMFPPPPILSAAFGWPAKSFLVNVLVLLTLEVCDQDLTHSWDTPKNISIES